MVVKLIIGLALILLGAELFTNGIEWVGKKLRLSQSAVGSILAAVGTALPESIVPVVAVFAGTGAAGAHIGVGAILGAPFMLGTLGISLVGLGALAYRQRRKSAGIVVVNKVQMQRDMYFFLSFYVFAVLAAFLPAWSRQVIAAGLVLGYGFYVWRTLQAECSGMGDCPPLYLSRKNPEPATGMAVLQVIGALLTIIVGAKLFVDGIESIAAWLDLSPLVVAMVLAPVATELPEKLNSIIWMRQSKDILATGNMTGAMVFQSSLLPAFGMVFTPWHLEGLALTSALMSIAAGAGVLFLNTRYNGKIPGKFLAVFFTLYLVFAGLVVLSL